MNWNNPQKIKNLRLRLGWSPAEMSRRLGCSMETVYKLESGELVPDMEVSNQLLSLWSHCEDYVQKTKKRPVADKVLRGENLQQICNSDLPSLSHGITRKFKN